MNRTYTFVAIAVLFGAIPVASRANVIGIQNPAGYSSRIDGTGNDAIYATTLDAAGNYYVVGRSWSEQEAKIDTIRDDPSDTTGRPIRASTTAFPVDPSASSRTLFVIKYDHDGNVVWKQSVRSQSFDLSSGNPVTSTASGVAVDSSGNVYVSGYFGLPITFGSFTLTPGARKNNGFTGSDPNVQVDANVFVAMLDRDGVWQWARQFDFAVFSTNGTNAKNLQADLTDPVRLALTQDPEVDTPSELGQSLGRGLVIDKEGNLYLKMLVYYTLLRDNPPSGAAGAKIFWLRSRGGGQVPLFATNAAVVQARYQPTVFLTKLSITPNPTGTPTYDWSWAAPVTSGVVFEPFDGQGADDGKIVSISVGFSSIGATGDINAMAVDNNGFLYFTGMWNGNLVAKGTGSAQVRTNSAFRDGFVARWRTDDATPLYLATYTPTDANTAVSPGGGLLVDENRNVFVVGAAGGTTLKCIDDTITSFSNFNLGAAGSTKLFAAKLDPTGKWLWEIAPGQTSTGYFASGTAIARDSAGALYVAGAYRGPSSGSSLLTFGPAAITHPGGGGADAFVAKLTEDDINTRIWHWALQTNGVASSGQSTYDVATLTAGQGGTVYWALNGLDLTLTTRFAFQRLPQGSDPSLDDIVRRGSFILPIEQDNPKLSSAFNVTTNIVCGKEVPPPDGSFHTVQPDIVPADVANSFFWDSFASKLYAVSPVVATVKWRVVADMQDGRRIQQAVSTVWPNTAPDVITHVTGGGANGDEPPVNLAPADNPQDGFVFNYTYQSLLYQDSNAQVSGANVFSSKADGHAVLLYTVGKNKKLGEAPVSLDVIHTVLWNNPAVKVDDVATIGREINGKVAYSHADHSGKNGYVLNAKARFDGTQEGHAYDRATQLGPIIPVNQDEPGPDDDMVIIWSHLNAKGVAWPAQAVRYDCQWDPIHADTVIVIDNSAGSEFPVPLRLDPAKYQDLKVYHQPNRNLAGYNPNEEHAFLADSHGLSQFQAVFALRSDLNHLNGHFTSDPYTLVRYRDAQDGMKVKMLVCIVAPGNFTSYTGTAGTTVNPPYPLPGPAPGTTVSGAAAFLDRKSQVWAKSAGSITAKYFYPLQSDFWYDMNGDDQQDPVTNVPWMDIYAGTPGTPLAINYTISWPAGVPTLPVGDTLTTARDGGLPDVEHMASASVIYEQPPTGTVRIIDYTAERRVHLDATIDPGTQSLNVGSASLVVELTDTGRYRFRDLPFHLKNRLTFDPSTSDIVLGGYKDGSGAGVPLLLLNVLSAGDQSRLQKFDDGTVSSSAWDNAIHALYLLSRNPNGVTGGVPGDYFVGFKGTAASLVPADALGLKALSVGKATGLGYVTFVENDSRDPSIKNLPVSLHVLRVGNAPVPNGPGDNLPVVGEIKVLKSENALDEKITLHHSSDFGGDPDGFPADRLFFEWYYHDDSGVAGIYPPPPPSPVSPQSNGWSLLASGKGVTDVVIEGSGIKTLQDGWVICRYRGYSAGGLDPNAFPATWAGAPGSTPGNFTAAFVQGWIKRAITGINFFDQRFMSFGSTPVATYSSAVLQAGQRYEGAVALKNDEAYLNGIGLIELYETIIQRGFNLSINASPPTTSAAVNNALLFAATRIADLYTLIGNEAYADAQDPTIGFTSADGEVGNLAPSIFSFANQVPNLISEELALLRGRDNSSATTRAAPVYNRLYWNFTAGLEGQTVYVQNYGITDQTGDSRVDEKDARKLFPQGHGDAWGHYLSALKSHYRLLRHPLYIWIPRAETTLVAGVPIEVDYTDEVKFARTAAALAKTGAEIVNLTYRDSYVADPSGQWQGYKDTDTTRAWGVDEWARRAGQSAYFNWLTANAILPAVHTASLQNPGGPPPSGLEKIDRTTVTELREISAAYVQVQSQMDRADQGLNPLGVTPGSIPFDIDPAFLIIGSGIQGKKHFEQIYERTISAVSSARQVFDYANDLTRRLRQTQISSDGFAQDVREREMDFRNRLIEIYGYPYPHDMGSGKLYPADYNGPDLRNFMYVEANQVSGSQFKAPDTNFTRLLQPFKQPWTVPEGGASSAADFKQVENIYFTADTSTPEVSNHVPFQLTDPLTTSADWKFIAQPDWGQRKAPGKIQLDIADILRAQTELKRGLLAYNNHIAQIKDEVDLLRERFNIQNNQINILNKQRNDLKTMNNQIAILQGVSIATGAAADITDRFVEATTETAEPEIAVVGAFVATAFQVVSAGTEIAANTIELAKEDVSQATDIEIEKSNFKFEVQEALKSVEALLREEPGLRLDLFNLREALRSSANNLAIDVAEGERIKEERKVYDQKVAGAVTQNRYQDMTFRLFRNDALQKYRAAFDLAARYVYLAATTYDYETCQLSTSTQAGRRFLTDIVRERALGQYNDDDPVVGVNGLSDPLARMNQNYQILKGRLGINNPQIETGRFSLRSELLRIVADSNKETCDANDNDCRARNAARDEANTRWREQLQKYRVADLWKVPEFRRFCRPFAPESSGAQPGLVIPFETTITFGQNYFNMPLGPGDSSYDSANFVTKINGAGVWFSNYSTQGLSTTPRVYLVPVGLDIMRAPDDVNLSTREFDVVDQAIPVPFPVGNSDLNNPNWIPQNDDLDGPFNDIRKFSRFRAYHDDGFEEGDLTLDTRLVGRSVWNSKWMLIIPGGTFLGDPNAGLDTFILGQARDGNGVSDIKIFYETYAFSGN